MMAPIEVYIGTYGDRSWMELALERAMPSVEEQTMSDTVVHVIHRDTLHEARNDALTSATREWLCFLDADDELDSHYLEAMTERVRGLEGDALIQPATLGVHPDGWEEEPVLIPPKSLIDGNFMVIGTLIRTEQFRRLGGFHPWDYAEDWDLWLRAWIDGAELLTAPDAIYRVHVSQGRNSAPRAQQEATYHAIRATHLERAQGKLATPPTSRRS